MTCFPAGVSRDEALAILGDMTRSATSANKTSEALLALGTGMQRKLTDEVPFSSARKWSAVAFDDADRRGVYVLGAPEMLTGAAPLDEGQRHQAEAWANGGLRVLVLAASAETTHLQDSGEPVLPPLTVLAVVAFRAQLRPKQNETIRGIPAQRRGASRLPRATTRRRSRRWRGRRNPDRDEGNLRAGPWSQLGPAEFAQAAIEHTVLGGYNTAQKEALVDALRGRGHYVAMIGVGVR